MLHLPRHALIYKNAFVVMSCITLFGCSAIDETRSQEQLHLLDGVLSIDVLPGSFATKDCGIDSHDLETSNYKCVAFPLVSKLEEDKNWDAEYLNALDKNGWKWAGGEGNAYYLEKVASPDCSYSMSMIGWLQGTEEQIKIYFDTGELGEIKNQTYIFALDKEQKCGNERNAK